MASTQPTSEEGQFSDAEVKQDQEITRAGFNYIDTSESDDNLYTPPLSESDEGDLDSDYVYDDARVEDEDWEIAEKGVLPSMRFLGRWMSLSHRS